MSGKNVPTAELEVLACLQRLEQATAREIRESMQQYRPMAHGSVVNLLKRLEAKSLVTRKKGHVGKAFIYSTTQAAGSIYRNLLSRLLNRVFGGDSLSLVASLFETKPPDPEQLAKLEKLLSDLRAKQRGKERP
ncbi:MAG: BlaI/MecI/CopY family transcriptional regulator [Acidobacteriia bacterium]|nr:BlaI/MecI/CopY family transcriptional regulator [Terriglobia bacterium]